mmetsp:Transcript_152252/g.280122  ORF Transcript_152252/g.280122 Transcript_152252/m.280122 type:complete len:831 (-) Transcript_152252:451-2943(-)
MFEDKSRRMPQQSNGQASEPGSYRRRNKKNKIPQDSTPGASEERPYNRYNNGNNRRWTRHAAELQKQRQQLLRLEKDIRIRLGECALSEEDTACIERCVQSLGVTVAGLGPGWCMKVFGSLASEFCTSGSDVDATCLQVNASPEEEVEAHNKAALLIDRLCPLIREQKVFEVIEEIPSAKVPILKLRFENRLEIDLSCQNTEALRNTRLLRAYASLDPRVRELGVAVKLWAKASRVCGAANGHLSSYTFTLMMIYFMQVYIDVMLPRLDPAGFNEESECDVKELPSVVEAGNAWSSYCPLTVADLMARFLYFYTEVFEWGTEVVSPRIGLRQSARDRPYQVLKGRWVSRIHVEDPYKLERNLHCVLGEAEEVQLREAFAEGWRSFYIDHVTPVGLKPLNIDLGKRGQSLGWPIGMPLVTEPIENQDKEEFAAVLPDGETDVNAKDSQVEKAVSGNAHGSPRPGSSAESTKSGDDAGGAGSSADDVGSGADVAAGLISATTSERFSTSGLSFATSPSKVSPIKDIMAQPDSQSHGRLDSTDDEGFLSKVLDSKPPEQKVSFSISDFFLRPPNVHEVQNNCHFPVKENGGTVVRKKSEDEPPKWWQNLGKADVLKEVFAVQGEQPPDGKSGRQSRRGRTSSDMTAESDESVLMMGKARTLSLEEVESMMTQARSLESIESDMVQPSQQQVTLCLAEAVEQTHKEPPAQRHLDQNSAKGTAEQEGSWRRFFPMLDTPKADSMPSPPLQPVMMTVEDLEEKISQLPKDKPPEETKDKPREDKPSGKSMEKEKPKEYPCEKPKELAISTLFGGSWAASTSSKIAARLHKQLKEVC